MGTLGGNLCLDTRCTYYNQSEEWRCSIDYCMKEKGTVCWVAPSSARCWAISASDSAPMLAALGARVRLVSRRGERAIPVDRPLPRRRHRLPDQAARRDPDRDPPPGRRRGRVAAAPPIASCVAAARSTSPCSRSPSRCGPTAAARRAGLDPSGLGRLAPAARRRRRGAPDRASPRRRQHRRGRPRLPRRGDAPRQRRLHGAVAVAYGRAVGGRCAARLCTIEP